VWCTYDVELLFPYVTPDTVVAKPRQFNASGLAVYDSLGLTNVVNGLNSYFVRLPGACGGVSFTATDVAGKVRVTWEGASHLLGQRIQFSLMRVELNTGGSTGMDTTINNALGYDGGVIVSASNNTALDFTSGLTKATNDNITMTITAGTGYIQALEFRPATGLSPSMRWNLDILVYDP
jgi:hypothetical protein